MAGGVKDRNSDKASAGAGGGEGCEAGEECLTGRSDGFLLQNFWALILLGGV